MALIAYDHNASPTAAATQFHLAVKAVADAGNLLDFETGEQIMARNWGQGADPTPLQEPLSFMMEGKITSSGVYGPAMKDLNESGAEFYRRMTGVPATKSNTLVGMNLGRGPLYTWATHLMRAQIPNAAIFVPKVAWPMYADILKGFVLIPYDPSAPMEETAALMKTYTDNTTPGAPVPVGAVGNWPENPTGAQQTDFVPLFDFANEVNTDEAQIALRKNRVAGQTLSRPFSLFFDNAYYHVCPIRTRTLRDENDHYLETGYEALDPQSVTPWVAAFSGSKALGTAQPGLFFAVYSDNLIADMRTEHQAIGFQQSGSTDYFNNVSKALRPGNDPMWINRWEGQFTTYDANKRPMDAAFPDNVVPGGVNLVGLYQFPVEDLMGKRLVDIRGETIVTNRPSDIVQAGGNAVGITVVENGLDETGKQVYLRVAFPSNPAEFAPGVSMYRRFIDHVMKAPHA